MNRTNPAGSRLLMAPPSLTQRDAGVQSMAEILAQLVPCLSPPERRQMPLLAAEAAPMGLAYASAGMAG